METNELSYEEFLNLLNGEKEAIACCCEPIKDAEDYSETYLYENCEICPECGAVTLNGEALFGCSYSPSQCTTCHYCPCDGSC